MMFFLEIGKKIMKCSHIRNIMKWKKFEKAALFVRLCLGAAA